MFSYSTHFSQGTLAETRETLTLAETLEIFSLVFFVDMMTPKFPFEIY